MTSSSVDERKDFFKVLNNHIARKTTATGIDWHGMVKILRNTKKAIVHAFIVEISDAEQREALSVNLNWLFNQLLYFALNDSDKITTQCNIELQKEVLMTAHSKERWWFHDLLVVYTSLLTQVSNWNGSEIELKTPFISPTNGQEVPKSEYNHFKIVVSDIKQVDSLIHVCLMSLTTAIPQFCNMKKELGVEVRDAVLQVYTQRSLASKMLAIDFVTRYLNMLVEFEALDLEFFVSFMQSSTFVIREFPRWILKQRNVPQIKDLQSPIENFFKEAPVIRMEFVNGDILKRLIVHSTEILFVQFKNRTEPWYNSRLCEMLANMLWKILENVTTTIETVDSLSKLVEFDHPAVMALMKFLILAEMESVSVLNDKVLKISPAWKTVHDRLLKKVESLAGAREESSFSNKLISITEHMLLAIQVEFTFTHRKQFAYGKMHGASQLDDGTGGSLMQFKNWNYKHVTLLMFEDLESLAMTILDAVGQRKEITPVTAAVALDLFSCVLKFSKTTGMVDQMKQTLLAIVAAPFYKCLRDEPKFNRLAGFQKVMKTMPLNFRTLYEKPIDAACMLKMQQNSLKELAQLEISRMTNMCWWLTQNIMQSVWLHKDAGLKINLMKNLPNFMINNCDKLKDCLVIYQKFIDDGIDFPILMEPLKTVLCLTAGNVVIVKLPSREHAFNHVVICDTCKLQSTEFQKDDQFLDVHRWMAYQKETKGVLISPDMIQEQQLQIQVNEKNFIDQNNDFKIKLIKTTPALLNHCQDFKTWIQKDGATSLFKEIFAENEAVLEELQKNLFDILCTMERVTGNYDPLDNCHNQLVGLMRFTKENKNEKLQSVTVRLNYIISKVTPEEPWLVRCLNIFLMFIIPDNSRVMGESAILAVRMADDHNTTILQFFNWYKTPLIRTVMQLTLINYFSSRTPLLSSLMNMVTRFNIPRVRDFLPSFIDAIIAFALPHTLDSPNLLKELKDLCYTANLTLDQAIEDNFIKIYRDIYELPDAAVSKRCLKIIEDTTEITVTEILCSNKTKTVEEVLIYYNLSPKFAIEVLRQMLDLISADTEVIADDISARFLGVLIYFEPFLTSRECERATKKRILLSLGDIIRLLGTRRVSGFCFKIITLLKSATEQTVFDLSEQCMAVWRILIRICDISSLGPILSTIFVSLDMLVDRYPEDVNQIHSYLIEENSSLLSRHISDLFFIEKTRASPKIKEKAMELMNSQRLKDEVSLKASLKSLIRQLNSENSDPKIRVYCLQYLTDLFSKHRSEMNELICGHGSSMHPLVEEILQILINSCKSTSNEMLTQATAECLGELGAIEPSLQRQHFSNQKEFPASIHTDEFARMALMQLWRSYQHKNDSKYIDALSLAIQEIFRSRKVTSENREDTIWSAIPEKMRPLMEPLLTSNYGAKQTQVVHTHPIFWSQARTSSDWAMRWASVLIDKIKEEATKQLLESLRPSMKQNQHTTAMFFPYILLHNLESGDADSNGLVKDEIQWILDVIMGKQVAEQDENESRRLFYVKHADFKPVKVEVKAPASGKMSEAMKVAKVIFEAFDFLENHRRTHTESPSCNIISHFLKRFNVEELAHVNYECGEYARAMIYLESDMKSPDCTVESFQKKLSFLTNIYAKLGSPDAVEGIQALKTSEWSLEETVLISNVTGNHRDSAVCFERMMQLGGAKIEHMESMLNSFISLNQPETALLVYENMIKKLDDIEQSKVSHELKAEPLWRLSRFDELEQLLADEQVAKSRTWGVRCGQLLLKFRADDDDSFAQELQDTRLAVMKNLKISGNEKTAYGKNYREVINLHLITEFEKVENAVTKIKDEKILKKGVEVIKNIIEEFNSRMEFVQKNAAIEEPMFSFHRIVLNEMKTRLQSIFGENESEDLRSLIDGEIGKLWIKSTKLACKNKMFQQAQTYILNAETYQPKELFIEKAKLHWIKKDQNKAFKILELGTNKPSDEVPKGDLKIWSKGKRMIALYNAEAVNLDFESNMKLFRDARVPGFETEKLFLQTAEYMDRHYCSQDDNQIAIIGKPIDMIEIIKAYMRNMLCGNKHVFQSMPRLLSIWLDTTAANLKKHDQDINTMNSLIEKMLEKLEISFFYTALSQLVSRICHESPDVCNVLKKILVKLVKAYPKQTLWFLTPMLKSAYPQRAKKVKDILTSRDVCDKNIQAMVNDYNSLIEKFSKLASTRLNDKASSFSINAIMPDLAKLISKCSSRVIMPLQCNLQPVRVVKLNKFVFNDNLIHIHKIKDTADVMSSLQKPKKITLLGDDGKEYPMLFKSEDDLRIDFRFQEISSVVNEFLRNDPESRERQLSTRTFSVVPLSESTGLIEWVPNLRTLKSAIFGEYTKKKHKPSHTEYLKRMANATDSQRLNEFRALKKVFYPSLGEYYRQQFPTPQNYFNARSSFIRTMATMSIIGYILGLGDRHCENILIDEGTGEIIHVDFNMLFSKGETLAVPETVPFRLTHNLIDAMGVLGIEGPFRKNCEIVLRVLQKEKNTLLSYLRPLIYDPMLKNEWKNAESKNSNERVEKDYVMRIMKIENKLKGIVSKYKGSSGIPLSTEGQVSFIIGEATNELKLSKMFQGWMPWV